MATISNYETPIYAKNGWLAPLTAEAKADTAFDQSDILPAMQQSLTLPTARSTPSPSTASRPS